MGKQIFLYATHFFGSNKNPANTKFFYIHSLNLFNRKEQIVRTAYSISANRQNSKDAQAKWIT